MQGLAWKDEYCIGVEEIDKQHMDFVKLINRFTILFDSGSHIKLQDRILLEIAKYLEYHCVSEENLMLISKYPNLSIQLDEHRIVNKSVQHKLAGLKEGSVNGTEIINYLIKWFMSHTQDEDRKFAAYLKGQRSDRKATSEGDGQSPAGEETGSPG